jgi:hypothetical protein
MNKYACLFEGCEINSMEDVYNQFSCNTGWHPLILDTLDKIIDADVNKHISIFEIKEKFGQLRIYIVNTYEYNWLENIINSVYNVFRHCFSKLRLYRVSVKISYSPKFIKTINKIIDDAEIQSLKICETCGSNDDVKLHGRWWIRSLCKKCRQSVE